MKIIKDTGCYSNSIFSFGIILILLGMLNYIKLTPNYCFLCTFLFNSGIVLIYGQLYLKSMKSLKYGIWVENPNHQSKLFIILTGLKRILQQINNSNITTVNSYTDSSIYINKENINSKIYKGNQENDIEKTKDLSSVSSYNEHTNDLKVVGKENSNDIIKKDNSIDFLENFLRIEIDQSSEIDTFDNMSVPNSYSDIKKYIKRNSKNNFEKLFTRVCTAFYFSIFLFLLSLVVFCIYYFSFYFNYDEKMRESDTKYVNENWIYTCHEGNFEIYLYFIQFTLITWLLIKLKDVFKYSLILSETCYIFMILLIWIFLGPFTNVF